MRLTESWNEDTALEPGMQPLIRASETSTDPFTVLKQVRKIFTKEDNSPDYSLPPTFEREVEYKTRWGFFSEEEINDWFVQPRGATKLKITSVSGAESLIVDKLHMWTRTNYSVKGGEKVKVELNVACLFVRDCLKKMNVFWNRDDLLAKQVNLGRPKMEFSIIADNKYHTYVLPVENSEEWKSTIEVLGLSAQVSSPARIDLKQLSICGSVSDLNCDGEVSIADLLLWRGYGARRDLAGDLNGNGAVDISDYLLLLRK